MLFSAFYIFLILIQRFSCPLFILLLFVMHVLSSGGDTVLPGADIFRGEIMPGQVLWENTGEYRHQLCPAAEGDTTNTG